MRDVFRTYFTSHSNFSNSYKRPIKGRDCYVTLSLTLQEVSQGTTKKVRYKRLANCTTCNGTGCAPGTSPKPCNRCNGTGQVVQGYQSPFGYTEQIFPCPDCQGDGEIIEQVCPDCGNLRRVEIVEDRDLDIEPGAYNGMKLRISKMGSAGDNGGPNGDLIILISVKEDSEFTVDGNNLLKAIKIPVYSALLGDKFYVQSVDGEKLILDIPEGTQPNTVLAIEGKGLPAYYSKERGDLLVQVQIDIPKKLTKKQRKLVEQLKDNLRKS